MAAKTLKTQVAKEIISTERQIALFVSRLKSFLDRNITGILDSIKSGKGSKLEAAKQLGGIYNTLVNAGLGDQLRELENIYGEQLKNVADHFEVISNNRDILNDADLEETEALINLRLTETASRVRAISDRVATEVFNSVIAGQPISSEEVSSKFVDTPTSVLETEINTNIQAYFQSVTVKKAEEAGLTKYLYTGPLDSVTRPFCETLVGQVLTIDEIKGLDNGQGLDVLIYGGGYNCRHQWRPITDEMAQEFE